VESLIAASDQRKKIIDAFKQGRTMEEESKNIFIALKDLPKGKGSE